MTQTESAIYKLRKAQASAACIHRPLIEAAIEVLDAQAVKISELTKRVELLEEAQRMREGEL